MREISVPRIAELEALVVKLSAALKPFADEWESWSLEENDGHVFDDDETLDCGASSLTVGDLRRAREALAAIGQGELPLEPKGKRANEGEIPHDD